MSKEEKMKQILIVFLILAYAFVVCEAWAVQQGEHLPEVQIEDMMLKKIKGATREGRILRLRTDDGEVTFTDQIQADEGYAKYYLVDLLRPRNQNFFLIRIFGYESKGYVLFSDKTGQKINLYNRPIFSPDENRFVDVSLDLDAGYYPNLIGIYKLEDNKYTLEWKHVYQSIKGPANPVWLNNSVIVFFEVTFDKVPAVANLRKKPFIIERKNNKWNIPRPLKQSSPEYL
jgi:hypothetical protein